MPENRARGPYAKGILRRQQILDAAVEVFARSGYHAGSLREIAKRVGLTSAGVMHHFTSKEELFLEVLRERDRRVEDAAGIVTEDTLLEQSRKVVAHNQRTRGLTSLYTVVSAEATDPSHPAHEDFRARYAASAERTRAVIADAQRDGLVRADLDAATAARIIPAVMDGLQQQWLLEPEFDMAAAFEEFARVFLLPPAPAAPPTA
ncbi:TetR/AcrR family transcriptional regulator [Homoserinibacter sp. YIM 151385]|uniref:TetR/AcrR family transcriptional regulator n=1 Tax=Homoserinibacter sp. YIM 151385 TaxID=2985506 RepID=UPI0022F0C10F|nr:TetR/AcrR family transcriptional regulator [Homoserinibacter sp. YIM 151385]WBU37156.1 TetR/AcrR family transcriptional regulator [Homoserinibacter sp. YIM 151385]